MSLCMENGLGLILNGLSTSDDTYNGGRELHLYTPESRQCCFLASASIFFSAEESDRVVSK